MPHPVGVPPQPSNADRCPLCGQPNTCAVQTGRPIEDCWCMHLAIAPAALTRIAPSLRGRACVCPSCASEAGEATEPARPEG